MRFSEIDLQTKYDHSFLAALRDKMRINSALLRHDDVILCNYDIKEMYRIDKIFVEKDERMPNKTNILFYVFPSFKNRIGTILIKTSPKYMKNIRIFYR